MQFKIANKALQVTAEDPKEVIELLKHRGMKIEEHIDALSNGSLTVTFPAGKDNGEWFEVASTLGPEWISPYLERLRNLVGYAASVPTMPAPRYPEGYCVNLQHTHIVTDSWMNGDGFVFTGFVHSRDWNGRTAAQRYQKYFDERVRSAVGDTKREPEFITMNNGWMKRNPNYLKHHAPHPACTSAPVLDNLLQWWLAERATPGQRDIVLGEIANHRTVCKSDSLGSYYLRKYERGFRLKWDGPLVTMDEFLAA
jgi:hypothetical protein